MTVFLGLPINLPHYLVQSMTKMSAVIKKGPRNIGWSLFHHGLVRMLVETSCPNEIRPGTIFLSKIVLWHFSIANSIAQRSVRGINSLVKSQVHLRIILCQTLMIM